MSEECREAFETEAGRLCMNMARHAHHPGGYAYGNTQDGWLLWQAAWNHLNGRQKMSGELLPCPFCNGEAYLVRPPLGNPDYVVCSSCGCQIDSDYKLLDVAASLAKGGPAWKSSELRNPVAAWNHRHNAKE